MRHLLARMVTKNVTSNKQTYAASLECLARYVLSIPKSYTFSILTNHIFFLLGSMTVLFASITAMTWETTFYYGKKCNIGGLQKCHGPVDMLLAVNQTVLKETLVCIYICRSQPRCRKWASGREKFFACCKCLWAVSLKPE